MAESAILHRDPVRPGPGLRDDPEPRPGPNCRSKSRVVDEFGRRDHRGSQTTAANCEGVGRRNRTDRAAQREGLSHSFRRYSGAERRRHADGDRSGTSYLHFVGVVDKGDGRLDLGTTRLGWIGLGRIGALMAGRLIEREYSLSVFDISGDAVRVVTELGANPAESAADLGGVNICFLCLPGADAIEDAVFGPSGFATAHSDNAIVVDHSTIDPDACRQFAERAAQTGIRWIDMPVSGGIEGAQMGKLIAWAGGIEADIDRVAPIVASYVAHLARMGQVGQGQLAKSCNQMIVGTTIAIWSEMLRYAAAQGLDKAKLIETLENGAAESPISRRFAGPLLRNEMPEKSIRNMIKDLKVALNQSASLGLSPKLTRAALEEFESHIGSSS